MGLPSEELPLSQRLCGEACCGVTRNCLLVDQLPRWLRHYLRIQVDGNYWSAPSDRLYRLRRQLDGFMPGICLALGL
jgi:hypothetical protein